MHMHLYRQLAPAIPSAAERSARMRQAAAEYPMEPEFHYHASLALAREARLMHAPDEDKLRAALYYVDSAVALNPYASQYVCVCVSSGTSAPGAGMHSLTSHVPLTATTRTAPSCSTRLTTTRQRLLS